MAARQRSARIAVAASALATLPYVVANAGLIASAEGSIVHMAPGEWAILTAMWSLVLWLGSAAILAVSAIVTRHDALLSSLLALLVFVGVALAIQPDALRHLFDPADYGFGSWVLLVGGSSTICALLLTWMAAPEVTLD